MNSEGEIVLRGGGHERGVEAQEQNGDTSGEA